MNNFKGINWKRTAITSICLAVAGALIYVIGQLPGTFLLNNSPYATGLFFGLAFYWPNQHLIKHNNKWLSALTFMALTVLLGLVSMFVITGFSVGNGLLDLSWFLLLGALPTLLLYGIITIYWKVSSKWATLMLALLASILAYGILLALDPPSHKKTMDFLLLYPIWMTLTGFVLSLGIDKKQGATA